MSIYATGQTFAVPDPRYSHHFMEPPHWIEVFCQHVPGHIGHPLQYPNGDPYASFLPPPLAADEQDFEEKDRAVVVVAEGFNKKDGQRYTDALMTLTSEEFRTMPFPVFIQKVAKALRRLLLPEYVYAIGFPSGESWGFTHGPTPSLGSMMDVVPDNEAQDAKGNKLRPFIVRFIEGSDAAEPIFQWTGKNWLGLP